MTGREIPTRAGYNLEKATRIDRMWYVQTNLTFPLSFIRGQSFMTNKKILVLGFLQAVAVTAYIVLFVLAVTSFTTFADETNEFLSIFTILLLFVTSACITGGAVLAYPTVLAFQKRFNEAGLLISATVVWLGAVVIITVFYRWLLINVL